MRSAIAFLDRDGTLIVEPDDEQVDSLDKLALVPGVMPALLQLQAAGYRFVVVTNQDGLGSESFPTADYERVHQAFERLFASQGLTFDAVLVCPHRPEDRCTCRKPQLGLMRDYLAEGALDRRRSIVVGDRASDVELAANLGVRGLLLRRNGVETSGPDDPALDWRQVVEEALGVRRAARFERRTKETEIDVHVVLDRPDGTSEVETGLGFFDHMLDQLARHGGFDLRLRARGDLHVDEHHTVEDTALALGEALSRALGDRAGIGRFGFSLPMDETEAHALIDLSGRSFLRFEGSFRRERVGELPTELVPHFFRSFADALGATVHLRVDGENDHHKVEACFKALARALRPALARSAENGSLVPSTKGVL